MVVYIYIYIYIYISQSDVDIYFDRSGMTNLLISRDDGQCSATFSRKISAETLASNSYGYIPFFIPLSRPYHFSISTGIRSNAKLFRLQRDRCRCVSSFYLNFSSSCLRILSISLFLFLLSLFVLASVQFAIVSRKKRQYFLVKEKFHLVYCPLLECTLDSVEKQSIINVLRMSLKYLAGVFNDRNDERIQITG